jgi:hypothetical protein
MPLIVGVFLVTASLLAAQAPESAPQAPPRPVAEVRTPWPSAIAFVRLGSFSPSAEIFKTVYGSGPVFGGEFRFHAKGGFYFSLEGGHFKKTGKLTMTQDPTTMTILPIDMTAIFHVLSGPVMPYVGAGGSAYLYTEENIIGKVSKLGFGFAACGGVTARWRSIGLDARLKYGSVKVKPLEEAVDLGGLTLSVAVGYVF